MTEGQSLPSRKRGVGVKPLSTNIVIPVKTGIQWGEVRKSSPSCISCQPSVPDS